MRRATGQGGRRSVGVKECDGHTASCLIILVLCKVSRRTETNRSREWLGSEYRGLCVISSETGIWACRGCPGLHAEKGCTAEASAWWCFSFSRLVELDRLCAAPKGAEGMLWERRYDGRGGIWISIIRNRMGAGNFLSLCVCVCL